MNRCWPWLFLLFTCAAGAQELPRRNSFGAAVVPDAHGVSVTAVVAGSPAANAGLQVGDVISMMGTHSISTPADFVLSARSAPASPLSVSVLRGGKPEQLLVALVPVSRESDPRVDTLYSAIEVAGSLRRTLITIPKGATGR